MSKVPTNRDFVFVCCAGCNGVGRAMEWDDVEHGYYHSQCEPCPYCDGFGEEAVEAEPIAMDDLPPPRDRLEAY